MDVSSSKHPARPDDLSFLRMGFAATVGGERCGPAFSPMRAGESAGRLGGVEHRAAVALDVRSGVWSRGDMLVNPAASAVDIRDPALSFCLPDDGATVWAHESAWCRENQVRRLDLAAGPVSVGSKRRTCAGYAPYFVISSPAFGDLTFHVLPCGDWRATFSLRADRGLEIVLDRHEPHGPIRLEPRGTVDLGLGVLVLRTDPGQSGRAGHRVQGYAMRSLARRAFRPMPVVYNTWFDAFARLDVERMLRQLDAAAEAGCEAFVIDAGWYGPAVGEWQYVGDWRENPGVFGRMTLAQFADRVRARGLDFGIWMEPERVHVETPVFRAHPDWFVRTGSEGIVYPDFRQSGARDWVLSEMARVVGAYGVKWLKIDCNGDFAEDPAGLGHRGRMEAWYAIVDALAARFPDLTIEGCASGGLRNDLLSAANCHTHFLSDTVDPVDTLRIGHAGLARLAPRMMSKWAVLYPAGGFTPYGGEAPDARGLVLCPTTATSDSVASHRVEFAVRAAMPGVLGIGGNLAGLAAEPRRQLAAEIAFYKRHREFIQSSVAVPLTPVEPIEKRDGFVAVQLSDPAFARSMIFAYHLLTNRNLFRREEIFRVQPCGLDPVRSYAVRDEAGGSREIAGARLREEGLDVDCPPGRARIVFVEAVAE